MSDNDSDDSDFYDRLHSWILYVTKEVMGVEDIRNDVLKHFLHGKIPERIDYGKTFSIGTPKEDLYRYLDTVISSITKKDNKIILFTCNNSYGPIPNNANDLIETHYQTFIVQPNKKRITMIDPSRRRREEGIYSPYAAMIVYFYIKSRLPDCKFYWLKMTQPCQVDYSEDHDANADVFCQSWSLYLQKEALLRNKTLITIPKELDTKYELLMGFYREILQTVPSFSAEFNAIWKHYIKTDPDARELAEEAKEKGIDVLKYMAEDMYGSDLYYHENLITYPTEYGDYINVVSEEDVKFYLSYFLEHNPDQKVLDQDQVYDLVTDFQRQSPEREHLKTPEEKPRRSPKSKPKRSPRKSPDRSPKKSRNKSPGRTPRRSPRRSTRRSLDI